MEQKFLDSNVILRFITQDNPQQSEAVRPIFEQLETGSLEVTTSESVIVEVVQVLSSRALYRLPRSEVRHCLVTLIDLKGLRLPGKSVYRRALDLYSSRSFDFVDALSVAQMEHSGITTMISFDRDFDRVPSIRREEPAKAGT